LHYKRLEYGYCTKTEAKFSAAELLAKQQNRSLNNYVETLLLDAAYLEPNAETIEAMKEAESGALRHENPLDLSSIEAMEKSMGL